MDGAIVAPRGRLAVGTADLRKTVINVGVDRGGRSSSPPASRRQQQLNHPSGIEAARQQMCAKHEKITTWSTMGEGGEAAFANGDSL